MSAATFTLPRLLYSDTLPSTPTRAMTRFGTDTPGTKFRFDARGRAWPAGHTVRKLAGPEALVATTLRATAVTLDAGTPRVSVTFTSIWPPVPIGLIVPPVPAPV